MHAEDRNALLIWFSTHPLILTELLEQEDTTGRIATFFQLKGQYRLTDVANTSHAYLSSYPHWARVRKALGELKENSFHSLLEAVEAVGKASGVAMEWALSLAAIGWMLLRQAGDEFLSQEIPPVTGAVVPRASRYAPGLLERLKGAKACERVIHNERQADAWFPIRDGEEITSAAEQDKRPYHLVDERCYEGMGVIPVDCRAGSCGTCWIGVLGGNDHLEAITPFETQRLRYFGYEEFPHEGADAERPLIRLACQVRAHGSVSIVIPEWNGVFGESRREREWRTFGLG